MDGTEEVLCTGAGPEAEGAEIRSEMGAPKTGRHRDAGCRPGGWRKTRGKGMEEEGAWRSGKGATGRGCCRLRGGAGSCGARCRWAWSDACRPGSG